MGLVDKSLPECKLGLDNFERTFKEQFGKSPDKIRIAEAIEYRLDDLIKDFYNVWFQDETPTTLMNYKQAMNANPKILVSNTLSDSLKKTRKPRNDRGKKRKKKR